MDELAKNNEKRLIKLETDLKAHKEVVEHMFTALNTHQKNISLLIAGQARIEQSNSSIEKKIDNGIAKRLKDNEVKLDKAMDWIQNKKNIEYKRDKWFTIVISSGITAVFAIIVWIITSSIPS